MSKLATDFNLGAEGDEVYSALVEAHADLSEEDCQRLDARLILLMANQIGDAAVIRDILRRARDGLAQ
jgi:hypothetical protein